MEAIINEFEDKSQTNNGAIRLMFKMSRYWVPYFFGQALLIGSITVLTLTSFAIDQEAIEERLSVLLSLILSLLFIPTPPIPIVTLLDSYFYTSFSYLMLVAIQISILDNVNYEQIMFYVFILLYIVYHFIFILIAIYKRYREKKKIHMTASQIISNVENVQFELKAYGTIKHRETNRFTLIKNDKLYDSNEKYDHQIV